MSRSELNLVSGTVSSAMESLTRNEKIKVFLSQLNEEYGTIYNLSISEGTSIMEYLKRKGVQYNLSNVDGSYWFVIQIKNYMYQSEDYSTRSQAMTDMEKVGLMLVQGFAEFFQGLQEDKSMYALDTELIQYYLDYEEKLPELTEAESLISEHDEVLLENRKERKTDPAADGSSKMVTSLGPVMNNTMVKFIDLPEFTDGAEEIMALGFMPQNPASRMFENTIPAVEYLDLKTGFDIDKNSQVAVKTRSLRNNAKKVMIVSDIKVADEYGASQKSIDFIVPLKKLMDASKANQHCIATVIPNNADSKEIFRELFYDYKLIRMGKRRHHNQEIILYLRRSKSSGEEQYEEFIKWCGYWAKRAIRIESIRMKYFRMKSAPGSEFIKELWEMGFYKKAYSLADILVKQESTRTEMPKILAPVKEVVDFLSTFLDIYRKNIQRPEAELLSIFMMDPMDKKHQQKINREAVALLKQGPIKLSMLVGAIINNVKLGSFTANMVYFALLKSMGNYAVSHDEMISIKIKF